MKHISSKQISSIQFPLPPLAGQERIAAKLDGIFEHVDASIKLLEQNISDADAMAESVLNEMINGETASDEWPMINLGEISETLDKLRRPVKHTDRMIGEYPYY